MNENEKGEFYFLESLALTDEVSSMCVGHFYDLDIETLVLAKVFFFFFVKQFLKQTILSIFNFNIEEDNYVFVDHQNTYKRIHSIFTCPQPHRYY
jgi:hypothetical protein